MNVPGFQSSSNVQGRQFADQCAVLLAGLGFHVGPRALLAEVGVEDKDIVEHEQRAHDAQGADWNNEVFPALRDLRTVLVRCGVPLCVDR